MRSCLDNKTQEQRRIFNNFLFLRTSLTKLLKGFFVLLRRNKNRELFSKTPETLFIGSIMKSSSTPTTSDMLCRGGKWAFVGAVWTAALPKRGYKSPIYRGGSQTTPTNRFVEAAGVISRPYKSICRDCSVQNRPYSTFFCKKKFKFTIQIQSEHTYGPVCFRVFPRSRCE